jgi:NAD(P)-dependent dehydrogenase (short-subunit alcohol dehydrogenase family)
VANPKVVVITGGSRGIGAETAKLFAQHGYNVCLNYVANDTAAERVRSDILNLGVRCIAVKADVSEANDVAKLFSRVDQELGTLTVLVNNAAILNTQARMMDISVERFNDVLQKNVISCFLCCKECGTTHVDAPGWHRR